MNVTWKLLLVAFGLGLFSVVPVRAQTPSSDQPSGMLRLKATANIVIIDSEIRDKSGNLLHGLSAADVQVTENGVPQKLISFDEHSSLTSAASGVAAEPVILVYDALNTPAADLQYTRQELQRYLTQQPATLTSSTALMVVGGTGLKMLTDFTTNPADLARSFQAYTSETSFKRSNRSFDAERFGDTMATLRQLSYAMPRAEARSAVVWVGQGFPAVERAQLTPSDQLFYDKEVRSTMGLLLSRRIEVSALDASEMDKNSDFQTSQAAMTGGEPTAGGMDSFRQFLDSDERSFGDDSGKDPYATGISFASLARATGGAALKYRNDVVPMLNRLVAQTRTYYTLAYRPSAELNANGAFRHVTVKVITQSARVQNKRGYYADGSQGPLKMEDKEIAFDLNQAATHDLFSYRGLDLRVQPSMLASGSVETMLSAPGRSLTYTTGSDGLQQARVYVGAAQFDSGGKLVGYSSFMLTGNKPDGTVSGQRVAFQVAIKPALRAKTIRFVLRDHLSASTGSVETEIASLQH